MMPSDRAARQPDASAPLIAAVGVSVARGGRRILDHVDLSLASGEIVTVIGPNGAGKSTLLKVLLGLLPPDEGSVHRRPGLRIGYLPQRMPFDPILPITVFRLLTLTSRCSHAEVEAVLGEAGVAGKIDAAVQTLSGGELQRVLLARAMLRDPDLLVLDEPLQGVDFASEVSLYELIGQIRHVHGCAVLMVSHDLHLVMATTDRVVCLNRHVCCAGPAETIASHAEYVSLFGPRAAHVLAVYPHRHDHLHTLSGDVMPMSETETKTETESRSCDGCAHHSHG
jgi:zinc transport system ATP-binding protein